MRRGSGGAERGAEAEVEQRQPRVRGRQREEKIASCFLLSGEFPAPAPEDERSPLRRRSFGRLGDPRRAVQKGELRWRFVSFRFFFCVVCVGGWVGGWGGDEREEA
jgi:hypothetical protein